MIADLKPYPEYNESGLPWLGQVPVHWDMRRLRHVCEMRVSNVDKHTKMGEIPVRLCNYVDVYKNERIRESMHFMSASASEDERKRFCLCKGDVVITKDSEQWNDIGVPALVEFEAPDLVCGYHLAILRARPSVLGPFLYRAIQCHFIAAQFHVEANGVTRYGLSQGAIKGVAIPLPPSDEQTAIVRFLDWANGRLERTIRAKRKVVALLTEQKKAIIHRAVTRGLDPSVRLKPSGISWLGDIPEDWEVRRLKTLVQRIDQGVSPLAVGFLAEGNSWGVLKSGCVNRGVFRETEHKKLARGFKIDPAIVVKVGDVLISRACGSPSLVGSVGRVKALRYRLILSDKTFRAVFRNSIEVEFMVFAMNCRYYRHQVEQAISGAEGMANNLPLSSLRDFSFAIPPREEATGIAEYLDIETSRLQTSIRRFEREIELLREYRTRLVADVVTGKLDVREAAARLPDEAPSGIDEEPADLSDDEIEPSDEEAAV